MSAFIPIPPSKAVEFVEAAGITGARRLITDFTAAGLIKSYAVAIETIEVNGDPACVRNAAVPPELWQRVIREGLVDDVWTGGTVRLPAANLIGGEPEVRITGIRFNEKYLQRLVDHHQGAIPKAMPPSNAKPVSIEEDEPQAAPTHSTRSAKPDTSAIPAGALVATVAQAQLALGVSRSTVNNMMNDGRLIRSGKDLGRMTRITVASIHAVLGIID